MYIYYMSFRSELTSSSLPENRDFWSQVEQHFMQSNIQLTDSDFDYKIPLVTLKGFFFACVNLNRPDSCTFGTDSTPFPILLKRHFMRHNTVEKEDYKHYISLIEACVKSKSLRFLIDTSMRERFFNFFVQNHKDFTLTDLKKFSQ